MVFFVLIFRTLKTAGYQIFILTKIKNIFEIAERNVMFVRKALQHYHMLDSYNFNMYS